MIGLIICLLLLGLCFSGLPSEGWRIGYKGDKR